MNSNNYLRLSFFIILILPSFYAQSQNFLGLQSSNYAGVNGIDLQPASLADNRLRFDLLLTGINVSSYNTYTQVRSDLFLGKNWDMVTDDNAREYFPEEINGENKSLYFNTDYHLPSFMIGLSEKHGIGFTAKFRTILNVDNVIEPLARQLYHELLLEEDWNVRHRGDGLNISAMSYFELGLSYARVLYEDNRRMLKVGGRLKRLVGGTSMYLTANNLDYEIHNDTLLTVHGTDVSYGHSIYLNDPFTAISTNTDLSEIIEEARNLLRENSSGWGADIGFVYEHRPNLDRYRYGVGKYRKPRRDKNKYKYKVGVSLLDLGSINFIQATFGQNFMGAEDSINLNNYEPTDVPELDEIFNQLFNLNANENATYRMSLPTAFSAQFDYRFTEHFALNISPYLALRRTDNPQRVHGLNNVSVVPRYESKWLDVAIPFSVGGGKAPALGAMMRLGPVIVGSDNIFNLQFGEFVKGANVYAAVKLYMPTGKPRDKDWDGVPDKKDECPEIAGLESLKGCREVPIDTTFTPPAIVIETPEIPFEYVFEEPVPEKLSEMPKREVPPVEVNQDDSVITVTPPTPVEVVTPPPPPKPKRVFVAVAPTEVVTDPPTISPPGDDIPRLRVRRTNWTAYQRIKWPIEPVDQYGTGPLKVYMPYADLDDDGVPNVEDDCPDIPGIQANGGCPEVEKGFFKEDVFRSLYFDTDKYALRTKSKLILAEVVTFLKENPDVIVILNGHTDDSGTEIYNVDLSENRAMTAKAFLLSQGVEDWRIYTYYFSELIPAASNKTAAGKQLNRRVDIQFQVK